MVQTESETYVFCRLGTQGIYEMVWMGAGDLSLLI